MLGGPLTSSAAALTPSEQRGERIYFAGIGESGAAIEAFFGAERIPVFGELAICSSCHGYDGLGRPESGILPSDITWKNLTKSYGHVHASGEHHPPFTPEDLKQLLTNGVFPGGGRVDPTMPVYDFTQRDLDDLTAYLKRLGTLRVPGVGTKTLRIGTVQTLSGMTAATLFDVIQGVVDEVNEAGGLYGRRLVLVPIRLAAEPLEFETLTQRLLDEDLFALVSPFTPGAEDVVWRAAKTADMPVIGPYTLYPPAAFSENRAVFSLFPGVAAQVVTLKSYLEHESLAAGGVALIYGPESDQQQAASTLRDTWSGSDWAVVAECRLGADPGDLPRCVDELRQQPVRRVVFLAFQDKLQAFLRVATELEWAPQILSCGVLAGSALEEARTFPGELLLSYPVLARDRQGGAEKKLRRLAGGQKLDANNIQAASSAAVAGQLLVHALRKGGREIDRRKLLSALEKLYRFETGLTPPLTFTANRRVGSAGVYVVRSKGGAGQNRHATLSLEWFEAP